MVTQNEVFELIQSQTSNKGKPIALSSDQVTGLLMQLYDENLIGDRHFYSQDKHGLPVAKISISISGKAAYCTVARANVFNKKDWAKVEQMKDFKGQKWPPTAIKHLLHPSEGEECVKCEKKDQRCHCSYKTWQASMHDFWMNNISLRPVNRKGIGGFARNLISAKTRIGEYTGMILPGADDLPPDQMQYHSEICIGDFDDCDETVICAWVDSTTTGSVTRFFNHSCQPNAEIFEGRCGMGYRILYVEATEDIEEGNEITIDYGDKWYTQPDDLCHCGSDYCKNPGAVRLLV